MNSTAYRAALMSLVLVLSSLAGCLGGDEEEDPTIMVSTYHVGELVSAVAGDTLDVEIISPSNIPVHDYEPSAADIARLMDSEIFFYHGLNLEPWVDTTLDALGDDAPIAVMTHTMPTGQDTLDYESVLISNLCEVLTEGPFESTTLGTMSDDHDDHDDHSDEEGDHDDDHDDHSDEEGDHDEDHDDHSDEEGHHEVGYVVIHIEEEGDYGFALPTDVEFFVLMNDDHDHGHDDHDDHSDEEDDHSDEEDDHDDHSSEEIEYDPHSWLSPLAFKAQADLVVEALSQQYPEHKDTFEENAEAFKAELDSLHMKYSAISDECEQRTVVANHNAYSYIGQLYDIRFVTVHGLDPEGEPSAADIAEVLEQIEEDGLTVLFVEEYTNPDAVAGIVEQTKSGTMPDGISIQTLYTMEMPPMDSEDNYLSLMEKNLDSLKAGMGC